MDGGEPRPLPGLPANAWAMQVTPDGSAVSYHVTQEGADEIWVLPVSGGTAHRLVRHEGTEVSAHAWSPDGTRIAIVKTSRSGDVVLLKRAQPQ